jgi:hypothetical protein
MTETHYCIICGEPFETDDPEAIFCPGPWGKAPVKPAGVRSEVTDPPVGSKQKQSTHHQVQRWIGNRVT